MQIDAFVRAKRKLVLVIGAACVAHEQRSHFIFHEIIGLLAAMLGDRRGRRGRLVAQLATAIAFVQAAVAVDGIVDGIQFFAAVDAIRTLSVARTGAAAVVPFVAQIARIALDLMAIIGVAIDVVRIVSVATGVD